MHPRRVPNHHPKLPPMPFIHTYCVPGLPSWLSGKEAACNAGDAASIPGLGRSPGGESGNPLQYSFLENPTEGMTEQTAHITTSV